jgi:membrane protein required for colicin V production
MTIFDGVLLVILCGFIFYGLFFGLVRTLGSLFGLVIGAWVASHFYLQVYSWVSNLFFGYTSLGKVTVFVITFLIIDRLVGFAFSLLDSAFTAISIIPFVKTINRLAGAVFGFIEGGLILGLILYITSKYAILTSLVGKVIVGSKIAPYLVKFVNILTPLFPEMLKKLQSII